MSVTNRGPKGPHFTELMRDSFRYWALDHYDRFNAWPHGWEYRGRYYGPDVVWQVLQEVNFYGKGDKKS